MKKFIINLAVYTLPLIISIIIGCILKINYNQQIGSDFYTIILGTVSLLAGYGFTAGFLLLALPTNNKYMEYIDKNGYLFSYAAIMFLTSLYGAVSILLQFSLQQSLISAPTAIRLNIIFFIATIVQFIWSFLILLRVLYLNNKSK